MTRELDAEVAEKVMGWVDVWAMHGEAGGCPPEYATQSQGTRDNFATTCPPFSTDLNAAMQALEKVRNNRGVSMTCDVCGRWLVHIGDQLACESTLALAICRAALAAVEAGK